MAQAAAILPALKAVGSGLATAGKVTGGLMATERLLGPKSPLVEGDPLEAAKLGKMATGGFDAAFPSEAEAPPSGGGEAGKSKGFLGSFGIK